MCYITWGEFRAYYKGFDESVLSEILCTTSEPEAVSSETVIKGEHFEICF